MKHNAYGLLRAMHLIGYETRRGLGIITLALFDIL